MDAVPAPGDNTAEEALPPLLPPIFPPPPHAEHAIFIIAPLGYASESCGTGDRDAHVCASTNREASTIFSAEMRGVHPD
jgi:hypothetical protein